MRQITAFILGGAAAILLLLAIASAIVWKRSFDAAERERAAHAAAVAHLERQQAEAQQQKRELERQEQEKRKALEYPPHTAPKFDPDLRNGWRDIKPDDLKEMMAQAEIEREIEKEKARIELQRELNRRLSERSRDGSGGNGRGGSGGPGIGGGFGERVPEIIGRSARQSRWMILLSREDSNVFFKKLVTLKAILVIPYDNNKTAFRICENLEKSPFVFQKTDREGIDKHNRLWFIFHDKADCQHIASTMSLPDTLAWFAFFLPHDLEQEMLRQEFNYKKLLEDELNTKKVITIFDVDRRGDVWDVRVRYQGPRRK